MASKARWYVINVYSGFENKVVELIREKAKKADISSYFEEMFVPSEDVVEIKKGQKVTTQKSYFPGYVLLKMHLTDESWHLVRSIPKVSSFLGGKEKPIPISNKDVEKILKRMRDTAESPRHALVFEVGEQVRVTDGPFSSFSGFIEAVDLEKGRLKVSVAIFGRPTPVELEFRQVDKL